MKKVITNLLQDQNLIFEQPLIQIPIPHFDFYSYRRLQAVYIMFLFLIKASLFQTHNYLLAYNHQNLLLNFEVFTKRDKSKI